MPISPLKRDIDNFIKRHPTFASAFSHPIVDPSTRHSLQQRALNFRTESIDFPIHTDGDLAFDVGTVSPTHSCVAIAITDDSALRIFLGKKLGIAEVAENQLSSVFAVYKTYHRRLSRHHGRPVLVYYEFVLSTLRRKGQDSGVFLIGNTGTREVFYTSIPLEKLKPKLAGTGLLPPPAFRYYGLHSTIPVLSNSEWKAAKYETKILLPKKLDSIDHLFRGGQIEMTNLVAISMESFASAKYLGLSLIGEAQPRGPAILDEDVGSDGGDDAGYSYCVNLCAAAAAAGVAGSLKGTAACAVATGGTPAAILCGVAGGLGILGSLGIGLYCSHKCKSHFMPVGDDGDGDDGDGDGEEGENDPGGASDIIDDDSLPTYETTDPWR